MLACFLLGGCFFCFCCFSLLAAFTVVYDMWWLGFLLGAHLFLVEDYCLCCIEKFLLVGSSVVGIGEIDVICLKNDGLPGLG